MGPLDGHIRQGRQGVQGKAATTADDQEALVVANSKETPKWITPMLLFIDLYEKVVLAMKRREAMGKICSINWKWFDVGTGKWQGYQPGNNKTINDAFWAGDQSVKFTTGRRKYNI